MTYEIPAAMQRRVRGDIAAIRAAFPLLDAAEANCVRMNRAIVAAGGKADYFPHEIGKLRPAVDATEIPGMSA